MDGKTISPETILDHIIAYTIGAAEVLEGSKEAAQIETPSMALVPFGPPFYTAILQAAGTLAIQKDTKTAMIIYRQEVDKEGIQICNEDIGPILGQTFLCPKRLKKAHKVLSEFTHFMPFTRFTEDLENQIYFIRALSQVEELILVGIGSEVMQKNITTALNFIEKNTKDPAIFFAANLSQDKEYAVCREIDEKWISDIIDGKVRKNKNNLISKLFAHYTKKQKKIPQILAYTNTGDLGGNRKKTNSYACLVA